MATVKKIKKAQSGIKETSDSTSYYKQRANAALKNLASDDLSNFGSNVKDFAKKQREYKSYTRRNKDGDDLKTRQYKRLGRIAEKNPERAEKVADRMKTRSSRIDRGRDIANPPIMRSNEMYQMLKNNPMKEGGMLKRADGSTSQRGLWDNLRSKAAKNKKSGAKPKAPTKAMLSQEKKIKSQTKKK